MQFSTSSSVQSLSRQLAAQYQAPRIVKLELILTEACNLGCTYCFEYKADHKRSMTKTTAFSAVDFLMDASRQSSWVGITFMGGEPLLKFDLIRSVVEYSQQEAAKKGKIVTFDMQTNGVLIREEHAKYFRDVGLRYCLSLDGAQLNNDRHRKTLGGSGTFQIVAAKIRLLKRYQPWQGARMTIMPEDAANLGQNIISLHEGLAINQFIIGFATHVFWEDRQIAEYAKGLREAFDYYIEQRVYGKSKRLRIGLFELGEIDEAYQVRRREVDGSWGCGAGSGRLAIGTDGVFHGCSKLAWAKMEGTENAPLPLGDLTNGMGHAANRLKLLDNTSKHRSKCQSCELRAVCHGGCYAANVADTGNMYVPADYFCKLMFAQRHVSQYAREWMSNNGVKSLSGDSELPDLTNPQSST